MGIGDVGVESDLAASCSLVVIAEVHREEHDCNDPGRDHEEQREQLEEQHQPADLLLRRLRHDEGAGGEDDTREHTHTLHESLLNGSGIVARGG